MLFNSLEFLYFFPIVTALYFLLPQDARRLLLLVASCVFYMAFIPKYVLILFFLITIDYFAGLAIASRQGASRRSFLIVSLLANLSVLGFYKYFNFFNDTLSGLLHWHPIPYLSIILPIGLSFHTFQSMAYTIEVYWGRQEPERRFFNFALYVMFYPQLVAGPIERPQNLLHQFDEVHTFDYQRVVSGLRLMLWGLFKKMVVADRLAVYVNQVYNSPGSYHGFPLLLATYCFAFQIYCDFSGYTDIARGAARVMGFHLMLNFDRPYLAASVGEFWRRWHISLSTWFRDYMYNPMVAGTRVRSHWYASLLIVFLVSGLWHGAKWNFVVWGGIHGIYGVCALLTQKWRGRFWQALLQGQNLWIRKAVATVFTFHLVTFAWIFFRANSIADALYIVRHLGQGLAATVRSGLVLISGRELLLSALMLSAMVLVEWRQEGPDMGAWLGSFRRTPRWAFYYAVLLCILFCGEFSKMEFIYFQF